MRTLLTVLAFCLLPIAGAAGLLVQWKDLSDNEDAFEIQRSSSNAENFKVIGTVGPDVESFTDNSVVAGIEYFYRIRAANEFGYSPEFTNIASGRVEPLPIGPDGLTIQEPPPVLQIITDSETGAVTITPVNQ